LRCQQRRAGPTGAYRHRQSVPQRACGPVRKGLLQPWLASACSAPFSSTASRTGRARRTPGKANGVWEIVKDSGTLERLPDGKLTAFNHEEAQNSKAGTGDLIRIRILKLEKGKSILFACNPHSKTDSDVEMVGAIVPK